MFFFVAVMPVEKQIPYPFSGMCPRCGRVCNYEIYMSASCLSLFFIPLFKFGKKYLVRLNCCGNIYLLDKTVGKCLENGENVTVTERDLTPYMGNFSNYRSCPKCGYEVDEDFVHCPKCGTKL